MPCTHCALPRRSCAPGQLGLRFEAVRGDHLRSHAFPLAPLAEQRRIVAEIEKQFTRLDASVAALKRVQANLKRYRASVLKAACEGRLVPTEAELARAEGRDYEPGRPAAGAYPVRTPRPLGVPGEAQSSSTRSLSRRTPPTCWSYQEGWVWSRFVTKWIMEPLSEWRYPPEDCRLGIPHE